MQISTHFRYATRMLVELSRQEEKIPVSLKMISESQNLPIKFIEQLISKLKKAKIVKSFRGKNGGYMLNKSSDKITLKDLFIILEPKSSIIECLKTPKSCKLSKKCVTLPVWSGLQKTILDYLAGITLADLVNGKQV